MNTVKEVRTIDSATLILNLPARFLRKQVEITVKEIRPTLKSKLARILEHPIKLRKQAKSRKASKAALVALLENTSVKFPPGYKFNRDELYDR